MATNYFKNAAAKVGKVLEAAFYPNRAGESKELKYLREIYFNQTGGMQVNQWYRILSEAGDHVGFGFSCVCGMWYQLLNITDWFGRSYNCPACQHGFDLFKTCGITKDTQFSQWQELFSKLPARPRVSRTPRGPRFIDTDNGGGDDVKWEGQKPYVPAGWRA